MSVFCVVKFPSEDTIEVVSSKWLTNNSKKCHWPVGVTGERVKILIKSHSLSPDIHWQLYDCELLKKCDSYERACVAVIKAVGGKTNLDTTAEENLGRGKRRRGIASYSERQIKRRIRQANIPESESDVGSRGSESVVSSLLSTSFAKSGLVENCVFTSSEVEDLSFSFGVSENRPSLVLAGNSQSTNQVSSSLIPRKRTGSNQIFHQGKSIAEPTSVEGKQENLSNFNETTLKREVQNLREDFQKFQNTVTRQLVKVLENQEEILRRCVENPATITQEDVKSPVELPLCSVQDFEKFNDWLNIGDNATLFKNQLVVVGGKNIRTITKRVLEVLLANDLAKILSLTGKGRKTTSGFFDDNKIQKPILKLLYKTVRSTKNGEGATEEEINHFIRDWLKGASDRAGGREARRRQQCQPGNQIGSTQNEANSVDERSK